MSILAAITHRTSYKYNRPVALGPQTIRLRPAPYARTPIISYALQISPKPYFLNWQQDPQGNFLARVVFPERVTHFEVTVDVVADMATINPFDFFLEPQAEHFPFTYDPVLADELAPFRVLHRAGPLLEGLVKEVRAGLSGKPPRTVDMLVGINNFVHERIAYVVRMEPGVYTPEETLALARGSCRDSAWLLVNLLRHLGYAARFVSGYLIQLTADQKPVDGGAAGPAQDFTDLHAWAEVYLPGAGWVGLDATSGLLTGEGHIPLAATPSPQSAAPISGGFSAEDETQASFDFHMEVRRIVETPRVTKPYTDQQWQRILANGARVDRALLQHDVRLTMGGEPTFVSATDHEGAEWTIDALGPTKREYAGRLIRKLAPLWGKGAVLTYNMGKHYPGEPLPRWAIHAHWRADEQKIWNDPTLLAADEDADNATADDALAFARALATRLALDPALVQAAYEDVHYYLWREKRLPANVITEDAKLNDPLERARLAKVFGQGLTASVGAVLPLRRTVQGGQRCWQSGHWFFKDDLLFLIPGDSPVGLRLPLESLPWAAFETQEQDYAADPFAPRAPLPRPDTLQLTRYHEGKDRQPTLRPVAQNLPVRGEEAQDVVRTALCVEARAGKIHIFYPPLYDALDWLELTAAIEDCAAALGRKVVLEGYLPPEDERLISFSVTPDPGVIECNIPASSSWRQLVERNDQLYEAAREIGLATEKFLLDGRHIGTGGGNHVVMGGRTAADSPFLRRPDLLKSMLGFWHNHPSLSFLFSGLFIGPSSQHPRIDEARQESITELEIAFQQLGQQTQTPPWLVDRLFRNILCDMTGNGHRTEFCIDKMYSPDSASGRRGLVEFRAFEMPPHPQMAAAQALLMRSAIAAFWERPYERHLVRWGTRLHDEFLLPHYCAADFKDALEALAAYGFVLEAEWFAPHQEFRFPKLGEVTVRDIQIELRHALEPWHVLGEEQSSAGTSRYVDSSVERLQVKLDGWVDERYVLACNNVAMPLQRTQTQGQYVAGVRFKAWQPYSALHPTIGAQTPLVFDVYDTWTGCSLGGMTYHSAHPGGRAYEDFPVNANAAEARRRSRFWPFGHTPGPTAPPLQVSGPDYPRCLDLRRRM